MHLSGKTFAAIALAAVLATAALADGPKGAAAPQPKMVDVAKQFRLLRGLQRLGGGEALAASIGHFRQEWDRLSPEQREKFRQEAQAFAAKSPQEQQKIIDHYNQLVQLSDEQRQAYVKRAAWLKVVIDSFDAQQRAELARLSPADRAKQLLERKAQLIKEGKLKDETPATAPATRPAN